MMVRIGTLLLLSQASVPFVATVEAASPALVALEYQVSPDAGGCPDAAGFQAKVGHQLGRDPFRAVSDRRVAVQITRRDRGFVGVIHWSDTSGRWVGDRRLSAPRQSCDGIATELAFSVAVQIQLLDTLASAAPQPPPPPQIPSRPPERVTASPKERGIPAPPSVGARPAGRLQLSLGLGPSLALGLLPQPAALGRIFVSGRVARFSLEVALDGALPSEQREADGSGVSLDRFAAGAAACGQGQIFAVCVTTALGLLRARGFGVDSPASPSALFSQVGARLAAAHGLGRRYFVAARIDAVLMLSSWTVTLNETAAWTTPRVGALVGVDLGGRIF
ncbi:MAG TPA: hypothetical protein VGP64_03315 [Polyangia bacterium]